MAGLWSRIVNVFRQPAGLQTVHGNGWWDTIQDPWPGAWQQNVRVEHDTVVAFSAVYACVTLISQDIGKLMLRLVEQDNDGIWTPTKKNAITIDLLRKPNRYQTRIEFVAQWIMSKLLHGNAYVLKQRDGGGRVRALYVLDAQRVTTMVSDDGSVFYQLNQDHLVGLEENQILVPSSEIIHDKMSCLFHPLIGVSPIFACGLAATQGLSIQESATRFFSNGGRPGGILTAPGAIAQDTADRLKTYWNENFTGANAGKIAVVGDGLKYEALVMRSTDAQLIEQLKWTAETVASVFHVPAYKIGVGPLPTYQNAAILNQIYYSDCLQSLIESFELSLDEGLELKTGTGTEFDLDDLLRMDQALLYDVNTKGVGGGWLKPDEARKKVNLKPVAGGDTPYLQQQNYSLSALAERDANDPFSKSTPSPSVAPVVEEEVAPVENEDAIELAAIRFERALEVRTRAA